MLIAELVLVYNYKCCGRRCLNTAASALAALQRRLCFTRHGYKRIADFRYFLRPIRKAREYCHTCLSAAVWLRWSTFKSSCTTYFQRFMRCNINVDCLCFLILIHGSTIASPLKYHFDISEELFMRGNFLSEIQCHFVFVLEYSTKLFCFVR